MDKNILRKWLKAGYLNKNTFYPTDDGTPQGGIISPILANLALDGLESKLRTRKGEQGLVNLVRYADDFINQHGEFRASDTRDHLLATV